MSNCLANSLHISSVTTSGQHKSKAGRAKNGVLVTALAALEVFITGDKNLEFQHN